MKAALLYWRTLSFLGVMSVAALPIASAQAIEDLQFDDQITVTSCCDGCDLSCGDACCNCGSACDDGLLCGSERVNEFETVPHRI